MKGSAPYVIANLVNLVARALTMFLVIEGVISLATKLGRSDITSKGSRLKATIVGIYVAALLFTLVSGFMANNETMETIAAVIGFISLVLMVVSYFMYLKLLSGVKKMLA